MSKNTKPNENSKNLNEFITWEKLKEFVNSIPPVYLEKTAHVLYEDNSIGKLLSESFFIEDDVYIFDDNEEDCGTLEELKMLMEDAEPPFDEALCRLVTKKGTPFLWVK
jgi:hypothetical protein